MSSKQGNGQAPSMPVEEILSSFHRVMTAVARVHQGGGGWVPGRLTMPQFRLLMLLVRPWGKLLQPERGGAPGPAALAPAERTATVTELARRMELSAPTVSGIIDRLVQAGYVERRRSEDDRRMVEVVPTRRGRDLVTELFAAGDERFRRLLSALEPEDAQALLRGLRALERAMREGSGGG
ncbi:MAG: MarR family transcriptional regulator [Bacillota bacterium]